MGRHAAPVADSDDDFTPDTAPSTNPDVAPAAPLGTVIANVTVEVGGFVSFDAAVRGAVVDASKSEGFRNLHQHADGSVTPVKQQYVCPACESTPDRDSGFVKGRPKGDSFVIVPQDVIDAHEVADEEHKGKLTVRVYDAAAATHALPSGKVNYLAPSKKTNSQYANLAAAMDENRDMAFVGIMATKKIAYRYLLTSDGKTITLQQLADPELVRQRPMANVEPDHRREGLGMLLRSVMEPFVAQERASRRSFAVEEYVETHEAVAIREANGTVVAPTGDFDSQLQAHAAKLGIVLPFPDQKAS